MPLFFLNSKTRVFLVVTLIALFLVSIFLGVESGKKVSYSENVLKGKESVQNALDFFYKDQGSFPSVDEFSNPSIMLNYLSKMPSIEPVSGDCSQNFIYKRNSNSSYTLNFCLLSSQQQYQKGWNQITVNK